jgi:hypothetical protein
MSLFNRTPLTALMALGAIAFLGAGSAAASTQDAKTQRSQPSLKIRAAVMKQSGPRTWKGEVRSPQLGTGHLTLTGVVEFLDHEDAHPGAHVLHFDVAFAKGHLRGCVRNSMYLRPGNRQVWDGRGRVTSTSRALSRYRGLGVGNGGTTPTSDLTVARPFRLSVGDGPRAAC